MASAFFRQISLNGVICYVNQNSPSPIALLMIQANGDGSGTFVIAFSMDGQHWLQDTANTFTTVTAAQTALTNYVNALNAGTA